MRAPSGPADGPYRRKSEEATHRTISYLFLSFKTSSSSPIFVSRRDPLIMSTTAAAAAASAVQSTSTATKSSSSNSQLLASLGDLSAIDNSDVINSVSLDGLALTKIVKHSKDSHPNNATGILLGLDLGGKLEVSNCFNLPNGFGAGEEEEGGRNGKSGE